MNKKGNLLDWFVILAIVFMFAVCLLTAYLLINTVDSTQIFADSTIAQGAIDNTKSTLLSLDNLVLFVIVGLSIFVLISSAVVENHPGFFWVGIFLLFIAVTVAGVVSNTFWIFTNSDSLSATAALFPKLTFLMENLPLYILFMGIAGAVVMYIGFRRE